MSEQDKIRLGEYSERELLILLVDRMDSMRKCLDEHTQEDDRTKDRVISLEAQVKSQAKQIKIWASIASALTGIASYFGTKL